MPSFGHVAAEDDPVLSYFLTTEAVNKIRSGDIMLVLGRKGTGKTALVRYFTETDNKSLSKPLNLRNYPWQIHETRLDAGASPIEAYVASWRYIIAAQMASASISHGYAANEASQAIITFFNDNYGTPNPNFADLLRPDRLKLSKFSFEPQIFGNKIFNIELGAKSRFNFGREIDALTDGLIDAIPRVSRNTKQIGLHFDELDQGLVDIDDKRKAMIVGLILAARSINQKLNNKSIFNVVIYLRSDIWDSLVFSDKNKINSTNTLSLKWDDGNLLKLINERLRAKLDPAASWSDAADDKLMRGSQKKWNHILARTFLRPRDVIKFLNTSLDVAKLRDDEPLMLSNEDIVSSREEYSLYLKRELDDEIMNHWKHWDEALQACSRIGAITFDREAFLAEYNTVKSTENELSADEALRTLYNFSVIAYEKRSGYGGSAWSFKYAEQNNVWDNSAMRFKVHLGLKEYAKLREERQNFV